MFSSFVPDSHRYMFRKHGYFMLYFNSGKSKVFNLVLKQNLVNCFVNTISIYHILSVYLQFILAVAVRFELYLKASILSMFSKYKSLTLEFWYRKYIIFMARCWFEAIKRNALLNCLRFNSRNNAQWQLFTF